MKIKKNLTYLAALALVASLAACGGDDGDDVINPGPGVEDNAGGNDGTPPSHCTPENIGTEDCIVGGGDDIDVPEEPEVPDVDEGAGDGTNPTPPIVTPPSRPGIPDQASVPPEMVTMDASVTCNTPDFPQQVVALINASRAEGRMCGNTYMPAAPPIYLWNPKLQAAAERHSKDVSISNLLGHIGSDGSTHVDRARDAGHHGYAGENLSYIKAPLVEAHARLIASPGHCENIMRQDYIEIGAACVTNPNNPHPIYGVLEVKTYVFGL